jgi:hypothetical protein
VLSGNVDGYYQVQGGPRNLLSGDKITLTYVNNQLTANSVGNVRIVLPPETFNQGTTATGGGANTAIGAVTITANRADVNSVTGVVTFVGNARAVSTDGAEQVQLRGAGVYAYARRRRHHRHFEKLRRTRSCGNRPAARSGYDPPDCRSNRDGCERGHNSGRHNRL